MSQDATRNFSQGASEFNAGGSAANHDEVELNLAFTLGCLTLRQFKCEKDATAHLDCVLDGLKSRSKGFPLVTPKVRVSCASGNYEVVIRDTSICKLHYLGCEIDVEHFSEQHLDILLTAQDPANRGGNVAGRESRGRNLVEQRLEEMVIPAIKERDPHRMA